MRAADMVNNDNTDEVWLRIGAFNFLFTQFVGVVRVQAFRAGRENLDPVGLMDLIEALPTQTHKNDASPEREIDLQKRTPEFLCRTIAGDFEFTRRTNGVLKRAGIVTIKDLLNKSEIDLIRLDGVGRGTLSEIVNYIGDFFGLTLRKNSEAV